MASHALTPLLVLIAMLCIAALASRRGALDILAVRASTLWVFLGAVVSPSALGFVSTVALDGLSPAFALAEAACAFFVGQSISTLRGSVRGALTLVFASAVTAALLAALVAGAHVVLHMHVLAPPPSSIAIPDAHADMPLAGALIAICGALALLRFAPRRRVPSIEQAAAITASAILLARAPLGAELFLVAALVFALPAALALFPAREDAERAFAPWAVLVLITGCCVHMKLVVFPIAFVAGALTPMATRARTLSRLTLRAQRPVLMVSTLLAATRARFDLETLALGTALGACVVGLGLLFRTERSPFALGGAHRLGVALTLSLLGLPGLWNEHLRACGLVLTVIATAQLFNLFLPRTAHEGHA